MQLQAQRKHVVDSGIWHLLHKRVGWGAIDPDLEATSSLAMGGFDACASALFVISKLTFDL